MTADSGTNYISECRAESFLYSSLQSFIFITRLSSDVTLSKALSAEILGSKSWLISMKKKKEKNSITSLNKKTGENSSKDSRWTIYVRGKSLDMLLEPESISCDYPFIFTFEWPAECLWLLPVELDVVLHEEGGHQAGVHQVGDPHHQDY
jgi:hypothetical protein